MVRNTFAAQNTLEKYKKEESYSEVVDGAYLKRGDTVMFSMYVINSFKGEVKL